MRRVLPLLLLPVLSLAFAPAPLPRPERHAAPLTMAGNWDVDWGGMPARIDLRPDGSARFAYTNSGGGGAGGTWNGKWRFDPPDRRVTLTLFFGGNSSGDYKLEFSTIWRDRAEGKIADSPSSGRPLKMTRRRGP